MASNGDFLLPLVGLDSAGVDSVDLGSPPGVDIVDLDSAGVDSVDLSSPAGVDIGDFDLAGMPFDDRMNGSMSASPPLDAPTPGRRQRRRIGPLLPLEAAGTVRPAAVPSFSIGVDSLGAALRAALVSQGRGSTRVIYEGSVDEVAPLCIERVDRIRRRGLAFYIGITENPERREEEHMATVTWAVMHVLYRAASSRDTGNLEQRLINHFRGRTGLLRNASAGGERRSAGSPHYLYVLEGHRSTGALTRRGRPERSCP